MLRNEPRDLRGWMHDVEQRLLTLWLENARQWYDMPRAEPPVPPLWLGGPWKPAPDECPCPQCVNVSVDSPFAAGSPWNLQRSSCGSYYGTDNDGNSVVFQKYSSSGEARVTWTVVDSETGNSTGFNAHYVSDESTDTGNYDTWCTTGGTMVLSFSNAGDLDLDTYPLPATVTVTPATCSTSSGSGSGSSGSGSSGSGSSGSGTDDSACCLQFSIPGGVSCAHGTAPGGTYVLSQLTDTTWGGSSVDDSALTASVSVTGSVVRVSAMLFDTPDSGNNDGCIWEGAGDDPCAGLTLDLLSGSCDCPSTVTLSPSDCGNPPTGSGSGSGSSGSGSGSSGSGSGSSGSGSGSSGSGSGSSGSGSGSSGSGSGSSGSGSGSSGSGSGSSGSGSGSSGSGSGSSGSGSSGSGSGSGSSGSGSGGSGSGGSGSGGSGSGGSGSGGSGSGSGTGLPCCSDASSQNWTIEAGGDGPPVQGDNATPGTASGTGGDFPNVWCGCGFFGEIGRVFGVSQSPDTPLGTLIDTSHLSSGAFHESTLLCSYNMAGGGYLFGQICNLTYDGVFAPPCDVVTWRTMTTHMVVWRSWNIALAQYQYHTLFEFRLHGGPWSPGCGGGPYKLILAQYYKPGCPTDGDVVDLIYQGTLAAADICYFPDTAVLHNF